MSPEELKSRIVEFGECWLYVGHINSGGYGIAWHEDKSWKAHRLAYLLWKGPIPEGMNVLHTCDNPPCINPEHLFLGTQVDNMNDMFNKGRADRAGSRNGRAMLTENEVREILILIKEGNLTNGEIAEKYMVAKTTISYVKHHGWMALKQELENVASDLQT